MTIHRLVAPGPGISVTNAEFLREVFHDLAPTEQLWTCSFHTEGDTFRGKWGGKAGRPEDAPTNAANNNYFCVSALVADGQDAINRDQDHFGRLACVVLDDVTDLTVKPTWKLETSPGNFQAGYVLETGINDVGIASRLHNVLTTTGMLDNDKSGNNPVRYVRLPSGSHTKYAGSPPCRVVAWNPGTRYELGALMVMLGLNPRIRYVMHGESAPDPEDPFDDADPFARIPEETLIRNVINGNDYHDSINRLAAKWVARGMTEHQCRQILRTMMLAVDDRSARWRERFDDVDRSVATAYRKYSTVEGSGELVFTHLSIHDLHTYRLSPEQYVDNLFYQDVGLIIGAGGVGKSSILMDMAIGMCRGAPVWGRETSRPLRVAILTAEDDIEIFGARLREMMYARGLTDDEMRQVLDGLDLCYAGGTNIRLTTIEDDVVAISDWTDRMIGHFRKSRPDIVFIDPAVSFGVGETRVNDAEQGLINAARRIKKEAGCAVVFVHHTGKGNARNRTDDQYSGRNGSAFADGARMIYVVNGYKAGVEADQEAWTKECGSPLQDGEQGIKVTQAKLSYGPALDNIYLVRKGWLYKQVEPADMEDVLHDESVRMYDWLAAEEDTYSERRLLKAVPASLGISKRSISACIKYLAALGSIDKSGPRASIVCKLHPDSADTL